MERFLRGRWPDAYVNIVANPDSHHVVEWRINLDGQLLEGSLDRGGQAIHIDADVFRSAQFALWFRTIVPPQQPLVFYDEGYSSDVSLTEATRLSEVVQAFVH